MTEAREFSLRSLEPLATGHKELVEVVLLTAVGDVDDLVGLEVLGAVKQRGEVGRSIVGRAVLLADDERHLRLGIAREARLLVMPDHERAFALFSQLILSQLCVDLVNLVAVEGFAEDDVGLEAELIVDALAGGVGDLDDLLPEGGVSGVASLELRELGAGGVHEHRVRLGGDAAFFVKTLEVFEGVRALGVELEARATDGEDEDAEVRTPVADVVVADEISAAEFDETGDGLADDDWAKVANVHLLRGVRRRIVDDDLAAAHQAGRAGAPLGFVAILAQPGAEGGRRELEINEAWTGDFHLDDLVVEPALGADSFDERGGEGARVGLGLLGGGKDAIGLEVGVTGIRRFQLWIEVGLETGDGSGRLAQQGVDFTGRIEPDGHASSRKPLRPLGKRRRPDRARDRAWARARRGDRRTLPPPCSATH